MTNLTQNSASGNPSDQNSVSSAKFPILVVSDPNILLEVASVGNMSLMLYGDVAPANAQLYLVDDSETAEIEIRKYGYADPTCRVFGFSQPLSRLLNDVSSKEIFTQILDYSVTYAEWCKSQDSKELIIKDALAIAKLSWENLTGTALKAELETLRLRCKMTSYDWNKIMIDLELEFKKELSRRGITYAPALDEAELLKLEIKRLNAEKDEAKKALIARDLRKQGIGDKGIESIARQLDLNSTVAKPLRFNSEQLLEYIPDGLNWLIPGLLPSAGISLLAGDPAAGKSTLAYDCAFSIISGEKFLGESPSKTGKVLFVVGDEPLAFAQDKLISRGFYGYMGSWELIHNWDISQMEMLEEALEDIHPSLVIFDSLTSINRLSQIEEKDSKTARCIYSLNNLLERYGSTGLLIHHNNKDKNNKGVNKIRGSSAIAAAVSGIWLLEGQGDVRKFTTPKLRGSDPITLDISLDRESGRMIVVNPDQEVEKAKPLMQRVKELFERLGYDARLEFAEIHHEIASPRDSLYTALSRLSGQGVLVKSPCKNDPRKKVYRLSPKYIISTSPSPSFASELLDIKAETYTVHGVDISNNLSNNTSNNLTNEFVVRYEKPEALEVCYKPEPVDRQESQPLPLTDRRIEVGGGVTEDSGQVAVITEPVENIPAEQLQSGDRISCYPTEAAADKGWKVTATVVEVEYQNGYLVECKVTYNDKKHGTVEATIPGGCADWILRKI